jgi:hypothetical protein
MLAENYALELQDENDELRTFLRNLRSKIREVSIDLQGANRKDLQEILTDTIEVLNKALLDIDSVL